MANDNEYVAWETAAEYGRYENCFIDHREGPFAPEHLLSQLRPSENLVDSLSSLEHGLQPARLPCPMICLDGVDPPGVRPEVFLGNKGGEGEALPLLWHPLSLQSLKLPCEDIDVGSDPNLDVQAYQREVMRTLYPDVSKSWLPLCRLEARLGEGLAFPPSCERMRILLLRELDRENITSTISHRDLICEVQDGPRRLRCAYPESDSRHPHCFKPHHITPPLSPMSECLDPFVPDAQVCIVDLTSEPDSPAPLSELRRSLENRDAEATPSAKFLSILKTDNRAGIKTCPAFPTQAHELALDAPLLPEDAGDPFEVDIVHECCLVADRDVLFGNKDDEAPLDTDFAEILVRSREQVERAADSESLDTLGCVLRLPTGAIDSHIPAAEWNAHMSTPEIQYAFLRHSLERACRLPVVQLHGLDEGIGKWRPVPEDVLRRLPPNEPPLLLNDDIRRCLVIEPNRVASEPGCFASHDTLQCFQLTVLDEEELFYYETQTEVGINGEERTEYTESRFFISSSEPPDSLQWGSSDTTMTSLSRSGCVPAGVQMNQSFSPKEPTSQAWSQILKRRRFHQKKTKVFFTAGEGEATNVLLGSFMQLRGHERPGSASRIIPLEDSRPVAQRRPGPACSEAKQGSDMASSAIPAPTVEFLVPREKGCFVISLTLGRALLKQVEMYWPPELLIDRDYTSTSARSARPHEVVSTLCDDADVVLTPTVGVVVTCLLKTLQKPLPGSAETTPLRQRLTVVCEKYERLIVLVSENNPAGELTTPMSKFDRVGYSDFVRFISSLPGSCICTFVPGANETFTKRIVSLMCKYSPQALPFKHLLEPMETEWELYLRGAGMNAMAAQIISRKLSLDRPDAFAQFRAMLRQGDLDELGEAVGHGALMKLREYLDQTAAQPKTSL